MTKTEDRMEPNKPDSVSAMLITQTEARLKTNKQDSATAILTTNRMVSKQDLPTIQWNPNNNNNNNNNQHLHSANQVTTHDKVDPLCKLVHVTPKYFFLTVPVI